jgi:hypothetical protein
MEDNLSGDNGKEGLDTPEYLAAQRLTRYQKDPQSFVEVSEIIACAIKTPGLGLGVAVHIGNCKRSELDIAKSELELNLIERLMELKSAAEMQQNGVKIIPPKGSMFNFARRKR